MEAVASRWMARRAVKRLLATAPDPSLARPLGYLDIFQFYYPLALTSLLNMGIQPIVTFFLGRGRFPLESLAVLPVVNSLVFLFRTFGLAGQETTIAMLSRERESFAIVRRFSWWLAAASSLGLALLAWTPLLDVWLGHVSGLDPSLARFAVDPVRILALMPAMTVWMSWQRAVLVSSKATRAVTVATGLEVAGVVVVMVLGVAFGSVGIVAAAWALVFGRLAGNTFLIRSVAHAARTVFAPRPFPGTGRAATIES